MKLYAYEPYHMTLSEFKMDLSHLTLCQIGHFFAKIHVLTNQVKDSLHSNAYYGKTAFWPNITAISTICNSPL